LQFAHLDITSPVAVKKKYIKSPTVRFSENQVSGENVSRNLTKLVSLAERESSCSDNLSESMSQSRLPSGLKINRESIRNQKTSFSLGTERIERPEKPIEKTINGLTIKEIVDEIRH
jgi:hypothetical protein